MWQRLNPDALGSESLNGFHFCFRLQLVDDYHFLHWVGPVFVEISNMCLWTTSKWEKNFGGHSQLIKEEVGVHVTGLFVLSLKSLNGRYWDTGCYKGAAFVSLCTPAYQKEANLMTSKFSFTHKVFVPAHALCPLYTPALQNNTWWWPLWCAVITGPFAWVYYLSSVAEKGNHQVTLKAKHF